ncbi:MAG: Smr/MutS family protein [Desulfobulbaceae bacterium]|nr:Smr/MutS family protein [Desulfobulbaceae bacterium]
MKRKGYRKRGGIPLLQSDDFPFAESSDQQDDGSFAEVFNAALFEKESRELLLKKKESKAVPDKQKEISYPQDQLDLHGYRAAQAEMKVESFLATVRGKGFNVVRIITGKGLHSEGGAVLPDVVERILKEMKINRRVADFVWEKKTKEESGALIVYL